MRGVEPLGVTKTATVIHQRSCAKKNHDAHLNIAINFSLVAGVSIVPIDGSGFGYFACGQGGVRL